MLAGEHGARAPEARGDLVAHEQQAVLVAHLAQQREAARRVKAHATGALHDRLEDDRRQLAGMAGGQLAHMRCPALVEPGAEAGGGQLREHVLRQSAGEMAVHAGDRVGQGHRSERVAVVAAPQRQQPRALGVPQRALELQAHLDRDLDRHGARVGEEHSLEPSRREREQALGQAQRGLVREPAEHHVGHARKLLARCRIELRVAVAVDRAPPRGHAVDQLAPIAETQARAARALHRQRVQGGRQRAIGMPNALAVEREQCLPAVQAAPTPRRG